MSKRLIIWSAVGAVLLIAVLVINPFVEVGPGSRGVLMNFSAVQATPLQPGLHVVTPIVQSVAEIDVRIQKTQAAEEAASHDLQNVTTTVATNWSIDPDKAAKLYQTVGNIQVIHDRIVSPAIENAVKTVTAQFDAQDLITRRAEVADKILTHLKSQLNPFGLIVTAVNIVNFSFSSDYAQAIERKQVAQQLALQAQYELEQKKVFVQQQVVEAAAAAQAKIEQAKGDAQATILRADAQAKANVEISKTLDPNILQLKALEKWAGTLPEYLGSGAPIPFLGAGGK